MDSLLFLLHPSSPGASGCSGWYTTFKSMGLRVTAIKIDPYLNIDAGTFSPYEHGECVAKACQGLQVVAVFMGQVVTATFVILPRLRLVHES